MKDVPPRTESPQDPSYRRAARFDGNFAAADALRAYQRTRRDLHRSRAETDLSVFRLQIGEHIGNVAYLGWYVALIGRPPDEALEARLERNLAGGTPVELAEDVVGMLRERRERTANLAPWVERRYGRVTNAELYHRPEGEREGGEKR